MTSTWCWSWGHDYDDASPVLGIILCGGKHSVSVNLEAE
jgi:hypothetical protein